MPAIPFTKTLPRRASALHARLAAIVCFLGAFGAGFAFASWAMVCRAGRCPPAQALEDYEPRQTSKLYAADGRFIAELGLERRTLVKIADIPPLVRKAFVVTEDKRFYQHAGIDWQRVPGALLVDLKNRNFSEGFSTITMQLARNIFPERISRDKIADSKAEGSEGRARHRGEVLEGQNPRALPQSDLPRQRRLRHRDGGAAVLRQSRSRI